jgi:hypothetical protein
MRIRRRGDGKVEPELARLQPQDHVILLPVTGAAVADLGDGNESQSLLLRFSQ